MFILDFISPLQLFFFKERLHIPAEGNDQEVSPLEYPLSMELPLSSLADLFCVSSKGANYFDKKYSVLKSVQSSVSGLLSKVQFFFLSLQCSNDPCNWETLKSQSELKWRRYKVTILENSENLSSLVLPSSHTW